MRFKMIGLAAVALMAAFGAAQAQESKTIAVSIPAADHGWTGGVVYHAQEQAKALEARYPGLKVIVKTSPDGASQANALEDLTTQGIDALVALPHNSDELTDPIRQVKSKGVFVTVVDRALSDQSIQDLYVAGNNPELGRVAGKYIKDTLGTGDVVVIRGLPIVIDEERIKGFDEAIAGSGIKVLDKQFGNWSRDDAFKVMQDYLTRFKQIDAVWASDDDMAVGVQKAIDQAKRGDIKMVLGGAGSKDYIKKVMDGDKMVTADVTYSPAMIADAMKLTAAARVKGEKLPASTIIPSVLVTKDNAKQYYFPDSPF